MLILFFWFSVQIFFVIKCNTPTGGICHRNDKEITYVSNEVVMAKIGNNAQLYCCIINSDFAGWVFLDNKITENSKYALVFDKEKGAQILTVNNVQESDSGSYFCRVNLNNREVRDFPVLLNIRAQLMNQNPQHYLEVSKTQRIPMNIIGTPFPTIQFFREGHETPLVQTFSTKQNIRNGRYEVVSDGDILIHNLQQSDTGRYVVRLNQGTNFVSDDYVIEVNVGARPFVAYVPKSSYNFTLEEDETIPARFSGSQLNIYWMFTSYTSGIKADRISGDISSHYYVSVDGALKVMKVVSSDAGTYIGVCKNPWGEVQVKTTVTNVIRPAQILLLNNAVGSVGSNVTISVDTTGDPVPSITWWRNGVKINSTRNEVQKSSIDLTMLSRNDAGTYTVIADNGATYKGQRTYAVKNVSLFIEGAPNMDLKESTTQLVVTDNRKIIEFRCVVRGLPLSEIKFMKDDQIYMPTSVTSGQKNLDKVVATLKLTIDNPDQTGTYVCVATNSILTSTLNINVKYMGIPSPPVNIRVVQLDRNYVKIAWDIPNTKDGPTDYVFLPMLWYGKHTVVSSKYVTQQFVSFEILSSDVQYYFSVRASNIAGWSSPSITLSFKTPKVGRPSPPQVLNREIFLPTNSIRLYWTSPLDNGGDSIITYNIRKCLWDTDRIYLDTDCEQFDGIRSNEIQFTGLLAYQLYNFYIVAQNQIDKSEETRFQVFSGPNPIITSPGPTAPEWIVIITIILTILLILLIDLLLFFFFRTGVIYWFIMSCFFFRRKNFQEKIPLTKQSALTGTVVSDYYPQTGYVPIQEQDVEVTKKNKVYVEEQNFQEVFEEGESNIRLSEILRNEFYEKQSGPPLRLENYKYTVSEKNDKITNRDKNFDGQNSGAKLKSKEESDVEETVLMERRGTGYQGAIQSDKKLETSGPKLKLPIELQDYSDVTRRNNINQKLPMETGDETVILKKTTRQATVTPNSDVNDVIIQKNSDKNKKLVLDRDNMIV